MILHSELDELDRRLTAVVPSSRQMAWQQMEFWCFAHFTVNTYLGKEWGDGAESESIFNPTEFDAQQWADAAKSAGMKGLLLTCKHHDGFCLWPSRYTEHTVANSPFRNGKGDLVKEVSEACHKGGIRFGVYLSPWDRNNEAYGKGKAYDDYFVGQLEELLTNYGEVASVWFDGACGEGPNGKKQFYDWERYYEVIRHLQPEACIHICGPDVRWYGNESGDTRESEWSVVSERTGEIEKIAAKSQQSDDTEFRTRTINSWDRDLGSRRILEAEQSLIWYPAEVNVSIRPGWFYHEEEDEQLLSLEDLLRIYYNAVGGNAVLLLNIPPTKEGLFHENDVRRLKELGDSLRKTFTHNLLEQASLCSDSQEEGHEIESVRKDDYDRFFKTKDGIRTAKITIEFPELTDVSYVVLKENILLSQRIESFEITAWDEECGEEKMLYRGTTVGYKKIARFPKTKVKELYIRITDARVCPTLSFIGIY